jgi:beta-N-acetylhexosaminidase
MPRSPMPRRRSRSVVVRRSARLPLSGPRPLVTRYGPAEAHQQAVSGALPTQRSVSARPAAPQPRAGWPAWEDEAPPTTVLAPVDDAQPTAVFNPSGLVAWALAPDDGPPTTVLHLDLASAEPDVRPTRGSTGAHRAVSAGSLPVVPLRRRAHRNPVALVGDPGAEPSGDDRSAAGAFGGRHGVGVGLREAPGVGPREAGVGRRAGGPSRGAGVGLREAGAGVGRRLAALVPGRPGSRLDRPGSSLGRPHTRSPRGPRRLRLGRWPVFSLVLGLAVVLALGVLVAMPIRTSRTAPPAQAALIAPGQVNGLALGDDRLPDCAPVVAALSPRQKLAQRLMVGVDGADPAATARLVHEMQIGGIFVGGTSTALLTDQALRGVQAASRLPLAVAVDDEGGRVQRVDGIDGDLPSARTLAATLDTATVQQIARNRGRVLAASGVTMNFAPDVDVSDQPNGAVIGDRSFSSDPDTVAGYAAAYAQGEHEAGIFTVLKHFPGHGRADGDSHRSRVTTPPLDQLEASDLTPYAGLLRPGGPLGDPALTGVMVGHLDVPGLTADLPSSLTPATYQLLRDTYQFDGLTITDDLGAMKAVSAELALPAAVQRALAAGADVALWTSSDPVTPVLDGLERALASGALDPKANDTAVARALAAKGVCARR